MITRIVRLTFRAEEAWRFPEVFRATTPKQVALGCRSNRMFQEPGKPEVWVTISEWESHAALEGYRTSELFYGTWAQLKPYFAAPAEAYSLEEVR